MTSIETAILILPATLFAATACSQFARSVASVFSLWCLLAYLTWRSPSYHFGFPTQSQAISNYFLVFLPGLYQIFLCLATQTRNPLSSCSGVFQSELITEDNLLSVFDRAKGLLLQCCDSISTFYLIFNWTI